MDKETTFISAVVYMRGDASIAADFVGAVGQVLESTFENYEIVAVDDCCSGDIKEAINKKTKNLSGVVSLIMMGYDHGLQSCLGAGVDATIGDFVYEFDGTEQDFNPSLILDAYKHALTGYDVVSIVPNAKKRIASDIFYKLYNLYCPSKYPISTERFRLVSRRAINLVKLMSDTVVYRKVFYHNSGLKCDQITYAPDGGGGLCAKPPLPLEERVDLAVDSLILFTPIAYRLSLLMSLMMLLFALSTTLYTLVIFATGHPVEGWTTTLLFLSISFFSVFFIFTIIIKYLSILVSMIFKKNKYIVESVSRLS